MSQFARADFLNADEDMEISSQHGGASDIEIDYEIEQNEHDENMDDEPAEQGDEMMGDGDGHDEDREMEDGVNWEEDEVLRDASVDHTQDFEFVDLPDAQDARHHTLEATEVTAFAKPEIVINEQESTGFGDGSGSAAADASISNPTGNVTAADSTSDQPTQTINAQEADSLNTPLLPTNEVSPAKAHHPNESADKSEDAKASAPSPLETATELGATATDDAADLQAQKAEAGNGTTASIDQVDDYEEAMLSLELEHPIEIDFDGTRRWMFPSAETDSSDAVCFLQDKTLLKAPFQEVFAACKTALLGLGYSIRDTDELSLYFDALKLELNEHFAPRCASTLADLIQLYLNLKYNDDESDPASLLIFLSAKDSFQARFDALHEHAAAGNGFSTLPGTDDDYAEEDNASGETGAAPDDLDEQETGDKESQEAQQHVLANARMTRASISETIPTAANQDEAPAVETEEKDLERNAPGGIVDDGKDTEAPPESTEDGEDQHGHIHFEAEIEKELPNTELGNEVAAAASNEDEGEDKDEDDEDEDDNDDNGDNDEKAGENQDMLEEQEIEQESKSTGDETYVEPTEGDKDINYEQADGGIEVSSKDAQNATTDTTSMRPGDRVDNETRDDVKSNQDEDTPDKDEARAPSQHDENANDPLISASVLRIGTQPPADSQTAANGHTNGRASSVSTPTESKTAEEVSRMTQAQRQKYYAEVDLIDYSDGEDDETALTSTNTTVSLNLDNLNGPKVTQASPGSRKRSLSDMKGDEEQIEQVEPQDAIKKQKSA